MSTHTFTPAGTGVESFNSFEGGHGAGTVRPVALTGMTADWRGLRFVTLTPGATAGPRELDSSEVILYVARGRLTAVLPDRRATLEVGGCLAVPAGGRLELINDGDAEVEFVAAEMGAQAH